MICETGGIRDFLAAAEATGVDIVGSQMENVFEDGRRKRSMSGRALR
jgi:hypothetical protein